MKVKFLQTRTVEAEGGETFHQGKVYDLPESSAARWIQRGVAELVKQAMAPAPRAAAEEAPAPKPPRASARNRS